MDFVNHYVYPSQAAEFETFDFHRPRQIDDLVSLFSSRDPHSPRIVELVGQGLSGRHYLLRAAAFRAREQGQPVAVTSLDLTGYEPDQP